MSVNLRVGLVVFDDVDYGLDLANTLHGAGVEVSLYLSHKHVVPYLGPCEDPVQRLYELGLLPLACKVRLFDLPRMRDPRSLAVVRQIAQAAHDDGVALLHVLAGPGELWSAILSVLSRKMPVASTMIIPKPNVGESLPDLVPKAVYRLLAWGSDVVIVNGADQTILVQELYGVSENRVVYVPLGPRTTAFKWSSTELPEEKGTVLFFGAARRHKGLEYLVRTQPLVTDRVPHARFIIVSRGEEVERCRRMIQDAGKFEIREGFVPGDVAAEYFQRASVVALPYLSASTSGILMTAYVFGRPVVATAVGCLPEYVETGVTGLLVPPADVEQLAEAIVHLLSDSALRQRMGKEAQRWAVAQQEVVAMKTIRTYEQALAEHRKS